MSHQTPPKQSDIKKRKLLALGVQPHPQENEAMSLPRRVLVNVNSQEPKATPMKDIPASVTHVAKHQRSASDTVTPKIRAIAEESSVKPAKPRRVLVDANVEERGTPEAKHSNTTKDLNTPTIRLLTKLPRFAASEKTLCGTYLHSTTPKCQTPTRKELLVPGEDGTNVPAAPSSMSRYMSPLNVNNGSILGSTEKKIPGSFGRVLRTAPDFNSVPPSPGRALRTDPECNTVPPSPGRVLIAAPECNSVPPSQGGVQNGRPSNLPRRVAIPEVCSLSNNPRRVVIPQLFSPARRVEVKGLNQKESKDRTPLPPTCATAKKSSTTTSSRLSQSCKNFSPVRRKLEGLLTDIKTSER